MTFSPLEGFHCCIFDHTLVTFETFTEATGDLYMFDRIRGCSLSWVLANDLWVPSFFPPVRLLVLALGRFLSNYSRATGLLSKPLWALRI